MAKNDFYGGKPISYLSIDFKECAWFIPAPKKLDEKQIEMYEAEGYKKRETVNSKTNETNISWRKYYKSVSGYLTGVKIEDGPYGQNLKIFLEDEAETNVLNLSMFSQNNSLAGYALDFIRHTGNIPLDEKIEIGINRKLKNDKDKVYQLLTICYEERTNQKGKELMQRSIGKDDMPAIKPYELAGKKMFNTTERDSYLCNVLEAFIKKVSENRIKVGYNSEAKNGSVSQPAAAGGVVPSAGEAPKQPSTNPAVGSSPNVVENTPEDPAMNGSVVDDLPF